MRVGRVGAGLAVLAVAGVLLWLPWASSEGIVDEWQLEGEAMGTTWHAIVLAEADGDGEEPDALIRAAFAHVDRRMSTWKEDSEISRFARAPAGEPFPVSEETAAVVFEALRVWALSDGAFDPTVLPLVDLWGFGPAGTEVEPPSDAQIAAALERCGAGGLRVEDAAAGGTALVKDDAALSLDLSAIAKGYAVDAAAEALLAHGYADFLVELGGEIRTAGSARKGRPWRIGIEAPDSALQGESLQATVTLGERALATSGDYRHWREVEGRRVSHTIDPRSGRPVTHRLASVTVLAPTCMEADALATACMVLGGDAALALVEEQPAVEALLVERAGGGGGFAMRASSGFPPVETPD